MHEITHAQPHAGLATNPAEIPNATCINANIRVSAPLKEVEIIFFFIVEPSWLCIIFFSSLGFHIFMFCDVQR